MGCASSKRIDVAVDVYRPAPSSFAVFDINAIEEPWVKGGSDDGDSVDEKQPSHVPAPLLEKLNAIDDAPRSWDEVSKALEDLKPKLNAAPPPPPPASDEKQASPPPPPQDGKASRIHTLEELEAKISSKPTENKKQQDELKRFDSAKTGVVNTVGVGVAKSLKDNIFIVKDREEREKEGKPAGFVRRDPLGDFEEICPPGGADAVVVYTTSLGGVRRTYEDCNRVRQLMETYQVVFDERDVALDGGFLSELRELVGEGAAVPRVFVKGRYIGGAEEVVGLNETGRLSRILNWARVERGAGRLGCRGCGGARFVPCLGCGGSCKIVVEGKRERERCGECNENGLVHCPICV
ncbi:hypothetical protein C2S53_008078 [Perilla frutescens var. hirtella]|uniref:Glutaredoxin domain-containing protein n=1 Tax=Perilla frutescens var. hirtella TaxID=608512 RepID=A0AAD4IWE0_PERFH|nr:hypothetical protein C2S53_008078 [Perilla frutescens var. hirtella]